MKFFVPVGFIEYIKTSSQDVIDRLQDFSTYFPNAKCIYMSYLTDYKLLVSDSKTPEYSLLDSQNKLRFRTSSFIDLLAFYVAEIISLNAKNPNWIKALDGYWPEFDQYFQKDGMMASAIQMAVGPSYEWKQGERQRQKVIDKAWAFFNLMHPFE